MTRKAVKKRRTLPRAFRNRIREHEERLKSEDFFVLIWGSGESSLEDYDKRQRIRTFLEERFGDSNVFMSEDEVFRDLVSRYELGVAEAIQAGSVDGLVILDTSIGPHSEILKYEDIILGKAIVFASHEHKSSTGFAAVAYNALKTEGYTEDEYKTCETIRRKANAFLQGLRFMKATKKSAGGLFGV